MVESEYTTLIENIKNKLLHELETLESNTISDTHKFEYVRGRLLSLYGVISIMDVLSEDIKKRVTAFL